MFTKLANFYNRFENRASTMRLPVLAALYIIAYLVVEVLVDDRIRLYNFCVLLALSGVYFAWLLGGRKSMGYVAFFNLLFVTIFSQLLWEHGIIIYGGELFLARSFLIMYALALGLLFLMFYKTSPADARLQRQQEAVEAARQRQQDLEFMVASRKLKQDLIAQANIVKDELQLMEGAWRSNIHDIINDLPTVKERELYRQIIEPFQDNIIRHLRSLELHLTFDLESVPLAELYAFLRESLERTDRFGPGRIIIEDRGWAHSRKHVLVDRNKIWDMLVNILRNSQTAIDLTRIDRLRSGLAAEYTPQIALQFVCDGAGICLRITDNGGGISGELAARLYHEPVPSRKRGGKQPGQGTLFVKFFGQRMGITVGAVNTTELGDAGLAVELLFTPHPTEERDSHAQP